MRIKMPVTKQHTGRVVAAPARCKRYNIPDSELKGFGLRVEPPRQDGVGTKSWYVQAMAGTVPGFAIADCERADIEATSSPSIISVQSQLETTEGMVWYVSLLRQVCPCAHPPIAVPEPKIASWNKTRMKKVRL